MGEFQECNYCQTTVQEKKNIVYVLSWLKPLQINNDCVFIDNRYLQYIKIKQKYKEQFDKSTGALNVDLLTAHNRKLQRTIWTNVFFLPFLTSRCP